MEKKVQDWKAFPLKTCCNIGVNEDPKIWYNQNQTPPPHDYNQMNAELSICVVEIKLKCAVKHSPRRS